MSVNTDDQCNDLNYRKLFLTRLGDHGRTGVKNTEVWTYASAESVAKYDSKIGPHVL